MDVDLVNKYKPTDQTDSDLAKKKRKSVSPEHKTDTDPTQNVGSAGGNGGRQAGSANKETGRGKGRGKGKGEKRGGRGGEGSSSSKGGNGVGGLPHEERRGGDEYEFSTRDILATNSKLLARLCQDRREQMRQTQYVVRFPSGDGCIRGLFAAQKQWKESRPGSGQHPDGELHEVCWRVLVHMLSERLSNSECVSGEQKANITSLKNYLRLTIHEPGKERPPGTRPTSVVKFQPAGKASRGPPPEGKEWVWILKFAADRQKSREAHEETACVAELFHQVFGISIKPDTGPRDALEFELERQLSAMRM